MKIVRVDPTEKYFSLTWQLGTRCNYDCMYCPTIYHDATSSHHSLDTLKNTWSSVYEKTQRSSYKISFTGGEPTSSRAFMPFLKWLRDKFTCKFNILLTTNGSATYKYYSQLYNYVDNISFSIHSEHVNENKFFDMIVDLKNTLPDSKHLHVNIMDEFWNQQRIAVYKQILEQHQVSYNVNEIDYRLKTRVVPIFRGKLNLDLQ
jgi:MoaA/NifB/PqqE/SkfB family radical SAM enzyme